MIYEVTKKDKISHNKSLFSEIYGTIHFIVYEGKVLSGRVLFLYVVFLVFISGIAISQYIKYLSELLK